MYFSFIILILQKIFIRLMKVHHLVVQISDRLREIWELTLFQKGVTPGDSPKIWEKSRLLRLRLQESVQP